jgi:hypothetical protein
MRQHGHHPDCRATVLGRFRAGWSELDVLVAFRIPQFAARMVSFAGRRADTLPSRLMTQLGVNPIRAIRRVSGRFRSLSVAVNQ